MHNRFCGLTKEEKNALVLSLSIRQCYIETDTAHLRAIDAEKCGVKDAIKALTSEQMKLILLLDDLKKEIMESI